MGVVERTGRGGRIVDREEAARRGRGEERKQVMGRNGENAVYG